MRKGTDKNVWREGPHTACMQNKSSGGRMAAARRSTDQWRYGTTNVGVHEVWRVVEKISGP